MTEEIEHQLREPPEGETKRFDELRADLVAFLFMKAIHPDYLWLLDPHSSGVWEVRSHLEEPQIRVFGQFARKNVFVALRLRYRDELGDVSDPNWNYEVRMVRRHWRSLFPGYDAMNSNDATKLFSGATNEQYFKKNR